MKSHKRDRRQRAQALLAARAKRNDHQQLARLDMLLGKGQGAKRERARLHARIQAQIVRQGRKAAR